MTAAVVSISELTAHQQHVLDFLRVFLRMNDQLPTCKAIADAFGWASPNAAADVMQALERKGQIERNELGNHMLARRCP
jgi:repressor LexA